MAQKTSALHIENPPKKCPCSLPKTGQRGEREREKTPSVMVVFCVGREPELVNGCCERAVGFPRLVLKTVISIVKKNLPGCHFVAVENRGNDAVLLVEALIFPVELLFSCAVISESEKVRRGLSRPLESREELDVQPRVSQQWEQLWLHRSSSLRVCAAKVRARGC
jgi:hypothetical protein